MPKVSVIIPVYNAGPFIDECVLSLQKQTLTDCEFIFVNDGSPDNSAAIIKDYAAKDSRIILVNQENKGISTARNTGLDAATGEYVGFMDNDDYVKEDMFETLYSKAVSLKLDIITSKTILGRDGKFIIKESIYPTEIVYDYNFIQENLIPDLLKREDLFAVWNKLYNRAFLKQHNVRFPENRNIEEDSMFNLQAYNRAKRTMFIDYSGYFYRDVVVNESRKIIERDFFVKAVDRYHFDYKNIIGLTIDDDKLERLKAYRLMHRVFYLVFRCAVEKGNDFSTLKAYIKKIITYAEVRQIAETYTKEELNVTGQFQKLVFSCVKNQSLKKLAFVTWALRMVYSPRLSETLRSLNKN